MGLFDRRRHSDETEDGYHHGRRGNTFNSSNVHNNDGTTGGLRDGLHHNDHHADNRTGNLVGGRDNYDRTTGTTGLGHHDGHHTTTTTTTGTTGTGIGHSSGTGFGTGHGTGVGHGTGTGLGTGTGTGIGDSTGTGIGRHNDGYGHSGNRLSRHRDNYPDEYSDDASHNGGRQRRGLFGRSRHRDDEYRTGAGSTHRGDRRSHDGRRLSRSSRRSGLGHSRSRSRRSRSRHGGGLFDMHSGTYNRRPGFGQWLKGTTIDVITMVVIGAVGLGVYFADPAPTRSFPVTFADGSIVYPQFAYPLRREIIPIWAAALLGVLVPVFFILLMQVRIRSFWDANNAIIGVLYSVETAAVFQVFVKWLIGGLRPHFLDVCQPVTNGFSGSGYGSIMYDASVCTGDPKQINDSLESMPSGHSTAAFAGMVFLYLYFNAKLKIFANYHSAMWKLVLLYAPILGACLIAGSLTIDEFHNWYDVLAGAIIGTLFAFSAYRMVYASVWDFRFNHIPLTRHTPFSYGAGAPGAAGFETAVFTHRAGWGFEEAFGGAPFDAGHHLRGRSGGVDNLMGGAAGGHHHGRHGAGVGGRRGDLEHNAGLGHNHNHNNYENEKLGAATTRSSGTGFGGTHSDRTLATGGAHGYAGARDNYDNLRSTNAGPHDSNMGNKLDPRVDSDRDGRNDPTSRVGGYGNTQDTVHGSYGTNTGRSGLGGVGHTGYDNSRSTNAGPHDSNLGNKLDPRVDSDLDGSRRAGGLGNTRGDNYTGTTGGTGFGSGNTSSYDNPRSTNVGPHDSNVGNKLDPRVDSDLDSSRRTGGIGNTHGGNYTGATGSTGLGAGNTSSYDNPRSTNTGPHDTSVGNKLDPRVDSDRDGRNDPTSHIGGYGNTQSGGVGVGNTGLGSTTTTTGGSGLGGTGTGLGSHAGSHGLHDASNPGVHTTSGIGHDSSYDGTGAMGDSRYRPHRKSLERKALNSGERTAF